MIFTSWQKILSNVRVKENLEKNKKLLLTVGKAETATKNNLKVRIFYL